jgi:hypothetical protein
MRALAIATTLAVLATPAVAVPAVVYEETSSLDDLPIDPPYPVLALAVGTNSVLGGTSFSGDAVDSFAFSLPDGEPLTSITYVYTSSSVSRGGVPLTLAVSGLSLVTGDGSAPAPGSLLSNQNVDMVPGLCSPFVEPCGPSSPSAVAVPLFEDALPLTGGIHAVEQRALTVNDPDFVTWGSDYRIDLVVPETGARSVAAAAALALLARRRAAAA